MPWTFTGAVWKVRHCLLSSFWRKPSRNLICGPFRPLVTTSELDPSPERNGCIFSVNRKPAIYQNACQLAWALQHIQEKNFQGMCLSRHLFSVRDTWCMFVETAPVRGRAVEHSFYWGGVGWGGW